MYHYVRPLHNSKYPEIKGLETSGFERQLRYFKNTYQFIGAEELLDSINEGKELSDNSVILTFDDGLKDHYGHVFPILQKTGIQGLFFPPGKPIDKNLVLDVHKIHFILASCSNKKQLVNDIFEMIKKYKNDYQLEEPELYYSRLAIASRFDPKEIIFIKRILQRELPTELRNLITDHLFKKYVTEDESSFSKSLYLSYNEISEMTENNMYFGSHTYSHEWLAFLNHDRLEKELSQSMDFYAKINKRNDNWIMCYPYGNYNEQVIEKIKKIGFKAGLTTIVGDATIDLENAFKLSRFDTNDFPQ